MLLFGHKELPECFTKPQMASCTGL